MACAECKRRRTKVLAFIIIIIIIISLVSHPSLPASSLPVLLVETNLDLESYSHTYIPVQL